jgi:pyruvate dehydrogenase E2 component (dihydrolipoamide acetyltransferase)
MAIPVIIPKLTISMEKGDIFKWLKAEGSLVCQDEALLELETDKAIVELPSPATGTLLRIVIPEGRVNVEQVVGWIGEPGETVGTDSEAVGI